MEMTVENKRCVRTVKLKENRYFYTRDIVILRKILVLRDKIVMKVNSNLAV